MCTLLSNPRKNRNVTYAFVLSPCISVMWPSFEHRTYSSLSNVAEDMCEYIPKAGVTLTALVDRIDNDWDTYQQVLLQASPYFVASFHPRICSDWIQTIWLSWFKYVFQISEFLFLKIKYIHSFVYLILHLFICMGKSIQIVCVFLSTHLHRLLLHFSLFHCRSFSSNL